MAHMVCPWWLGYFLVSPIRKWRQNPFKILNSYIEPGLTAIDIGSGMGYFTIPIATMVGESGKVIAVDLQPKMISSLVRRARKAGVTKQIETRVCSNDSLGIDNLEGKIDFALTFAVLHEFPSIPQALAQVAKALKPGGILYIAEPTGHVDKPAFDKTVAAAKDCGLELIESPQVWKSHTAVMRKKQL
jgi:ubiquinone/menaquinone biosynthesis C-methylase UbiE